MPTNPRTQSDLGGDGAPRTQVSPDDGSDEERRIRRQALDPMMVDAEKEGLYDKLDRLPPPTR